MRIERLENSKHKQERVLVYLEDGTLLRITGAELLQFGLYQGLDLPPETLEELRAAARRSDTRHRGASMASGRMLSKKELTERLTKKGASPDDAAETADWLEDLGAVDDTAYAGVIVRHYGAMGCGAARVRQELHRRGVPKELWDEALKQLPRRERKLLKRKYMDEAPDKEIAQELGVAPALQRRGFSWQDIRPILNGLGQEIDET
mgnify:CR=1 FL=1